MLDDDDPDDLPSPSNELLNNNLFSMSDTKSAQKEEELDLISSPLDKEKISVTENSVDDEQVNGMSNDEQLADETKIFTQQEVKDNEKVQPVDQVLEKEVHQSVGENKNESFVQKEPIEEQNVIQPESSVSKAPIKEVTQSEPQSKNTGNISWADLMDASDDSENSFIEDNSLVEKENVEFQTENLVIKDEEGVCKPVKEEEEVHCRILRQLKTIQTIPNDASTSWSHFGQQEDDKYTWDTHETTHTRVRARPIIAKEVLQRLKNMTTTTTKSWEKKVSNKPKSVENQLNTVDFSDTAKSIWATPSYQTRRYSNSPHKSPTIPNNDKDKDRDSHVHTLQNTKKDSDNGWDIKNNNTKLNTNESSDSNANNKNDENSWTSNDNYVFTVEAITKENNTATMNAWSTAAEQFDKEASELEKKISMMKENNIPLVTVEQQATAIDAWNSSATSSTVEEPKKEHDESWDPNAWPSPQSLADQWEVMDTTKNKQSNVVEDQMGKNEVSQNQSTWDTNTTSWNNEQTTWNTNTTSWNSEQPTWDNQQFSWGNDKQETQWGAQQQDFPTTSESTSLNDILSRDNTIATHKPNTKGSSSWKDILSVTENDNIAGWNSFAKHNDEAVQSFKKNDKPKESMIQQQESQSRQVEPLWKQSNANVPGSTNNEHPSAAIEMPTIRLSDFLTTKEPTTTTTTAAATAAPITIDMPAVRLEDIISTPNNTVDMPTIRLSDFTNTKLPPTAEIKLSLADLSKEDRSLILSLADNSQQEITLHLSDFMKANKNEKKFNFVYTGPSLDREAPKEITMSLNDLISGHF
ncbi:uncharacterized protein BX663DRAFT_563314 [Cokeromyces recurvatus]|uniref:uncharacterized protein n=1 Tax=Cokeromyces recurvatus TaxID=90255 RepID=UPI0022200708|nr:uncharacterized protein BX663DRAFT_563314 [Cokeromyces recurvatus]KAI7900114.1 hypothetical protein BX663DRAFT_563314 [Cokeromyces recurvatus]